MRRAVCGGKFPNVILFTIIRERGELLHEITVSLIFNYKCNRIEIIRNLFHDLTVLILLTAILSI